MDVINMICSDPAVRYSVLLQIDTNLLINSQDVHVSRLETCRYVAERNVFPELVDTPAIKGLALQQRPLGDVTQTPVLKKVF